MRDLLGRELELWRDRPHRVAALRHRQSGYDAAKITRGRYSYGDPLVPTFPGDPERIRIGAFCSIADDVVLGGGGDHRVDWVTTFPIRAVLGLPGAYTDGHPSIAPEIVIGNDVWIGRGARVMSGVTIEDGAVIGAYAVVTKDVRSYAIVVGHPARELRRRFTDEQVQALRRIAWWQWPEQQIIDEAASLCSGNVDPFIAKHDADANQGAR